MNNIPLYAGSQVILNELVCKCDIMQNSFSVSLHTYVDIIYA